MSSSSIHVATNCMLIFLAGSLNSSLYHYHVNGHTWSIKNLFLMKPILHDLPWMSTPICEVLPLASHWRAILSQAEQTIPRLSSSPKDGPFLLINDSLCIWIIPVISHCSTVSWSLASTQTLPLCTFRTQDTAFSDHSEKVPEKLIIPIQNSMLLIVFLTLLMLVSILSWYLWQRHRLFLLIRAVEVYSLTPVQFFFCLGKFKTGSKWLRNDLSFTSKSNLALSFLLSFY